MGRTGNWAEDLGRDIHALMVWGVVAAILVPILLVIIAVLLVFR